jgi:hypothetical protein
MVMVDLFRYRLDGGFREKGSGAKQHWPYFKPKNFAQLGGATDRSRKIGV